MRLVHLRSKENVISFNIFGTVPRRSCVFDTLPISNRLSRSLKKEQPQIPE